MSVLVIGQHYWGHAKDLAGAKKLFRDEGGILSKGYTIVKFGDDLEFEGVDGLGRVFWKGDGKPVVTEVKGRGA